MPAKQLEQGAASGRQEQAAAKRLIVSLLEDRRKKRKVALRHNSCMKSVEGVYRNRVGRADIGDAI
jgi:hypothetical protein